MERKEAEQKNITVYWWNMGTKTLDFKGSYKDFLKKKDIKVTTIKHPKTKSPGYRFNIPVGCSIIRLDTFDYDYFNGCTGAIKLFLTYLGDRTLFNDGYNREHKINWR